MRHPRAIHSALSCAAVVVGLLTAAPASATITAPAASTTPTIVNAVPSAATGSVDDESNATPAVDAIAITGSTTVVGGQFASVTSASGASNKASKVAVTSLAAFDSTGAVIKGFTPSIGGGSSPRVYALVAGTTAGTVYVAGSFKTVDGTTMRVALLSTSTGKIVSGWKPPSFDGAIKTLALSHGVLWVGGDFDAHGTQGYGLAALDPTTGTLLTGQSTPSFTGHHNYGVNCAAGSSGCADGAVGITALAVNSSGTRLVAVGNFTTVGGAARDQAAMLDLGSSGASVDAGWATDAFTAACKKASFDSTVRDVAFSPDGSYLVVVSTGAGAGTTNTDGTPTSCDGSVRLETDPSSAPTVAGDPGDLATTWVDSTGNDSLYTVAIANAAVYIGGHPRWMNNSQGDDNAKEGATPRPGLAALDPENGLPLAWNPGRNPRGIGTSALLLTSAGLWVGSDTDYIGNRRYKRDRLAYFPLSGGSTPAPAGLGSVPGYVFQANEPDHDGDLRRVQWTGPGHAPGVITRIGSADWSGVTGALYVGGLLWAAHSNGTLTSQSFSGTTFGTSTTIDPYDDPAWAHVSTGVTKSDGTKQTYQGVPSSFGTEMASLTSLFYADGRIYYTLSGKSHMYWRAFEVDDGVVGSRESTTTDTDDWSKVAGAFVSGSTLFFADSTTGDLMSTSFTGDEPSGTPATADSSRDWDAGFDVVLSQSQGSDKPPVASFAVHCAAHAPTCTVDGSGSHDSDGHVTSYRWSWGDGTSTTTDGPHASHTYAAAGTHRLVLLVSDNDGVTGSTSRTVQPAFVRFGHVKGVRGTGKKLRAHVPAGTSRGDLLLLLESHSAGRDPITVPHGWTRIGHTSSHGLTTDVYRKRAAKHESGQAVTLRYRHRVTASAIIADYRRGHLSQLRSRTSARSATIKPRELTHLVPGSLAVVFEVAASPGSRHWLSVAPLQVRKRESGKHVASLVADTGFPVTGTDTFGAGHVSGSSTSLAVWSLALRP